MSHADEIREAGEMIFEIEDEPTDAYRSTRSPIEDTKRDLVGEVDFTLVTTELGPDAKVSAVRVPGKAVPEEMVKGMAMYGYLGPYQNDKTLGPVLKAIKKFKVEADGVVLSTE